MNDRKQPKDPSKSREHIFSPHTDLCVCCGKDTSNITLPGSAIK